MATKPSTSNKIERITVGKANPQTVEILKKAIDTDVSKYVHQVDNYALKHILKRHSDDPFPITSEDFRLIPDILSTPDTVRYAGKTRKGKDAVVYTKQFNGVTYYIEEVRTGRKALALKTMYKKASIGASRVPKELATLRPSPEGVPTPFDAKESIPKDLMPGKGKGTAGHPLGREIVFPTRVGMNPNCRNRLKEHSCQNGRNRCILLSMLLDFAPQPRKEKRLLTEGESHLWEKMWEEQAWKLLDQYTDEMYQKNENFRRAYHNAPEEALKFLLTGL